MARRLYGEHAELFSEVTGIPLKIIKGYWHLYIAIASRRLDICPKKFAALAKEIRDEWKKAFHWFPWAVSMHHWQKHVPEIMEILPSTICIAMLSEVSKVHIF